MSRITVCIWNSKGKRFSPDKFNVLPSSDPFEVKFEAVYLYSGTVTHWGYVDNASGKEHREPLKVEWPGPFGGELTIFSSIFVG